MESRGQYLSSIVVSPGTSTTYTVRGVNPGCPAVNRTIALTVNPNPNVTATSSPTLICAGEFAALVAGGAQSYLWNTGSTNTILVLSPAITTTYVVTGTSSSGCVGTATIVQNVSECAGLEQIDARKDLSLVIYPNPNSGSFVITSTSSVSSLTLINELGQVVKCITQGELNGGTKAFSDLKSGIYFVVARSQNRCVTEKVIVASGD
jgi:hypothetical protein